MNRLIKIFDGYFDFVNLSASLSSKCLISGSATQRRERKKRYQISQRNKPAIKRSANIPAI